MGDNLAVKAFVHALRRDHGVIDGDVPHSVIRYFFFNEISHDKAEKPDRLCYTGYGKIIPCKGGPRGR